MVFVDFSKAFLSINHQAMFNIPQRITNAIMLKCNNIKGKVLSPDGETYYYKYVPELCWVTLAPYLFVTVASHTRNWRGAA